MNKILYVIAVMLAVSNWAQGFERTKVVYAINGGIAAEPKYVQIFIAGYESAGGTWTGESDTVTLSSTGQFISVALPLALSNGSNLVINNFPLGFVDALHTSEIAADAYYTLGIQSVVAAGSNQHHFYSHPNFIRNVITVSAGDTAGMTGYYNEFFNDHPFNLYPITSLTQGTSDTAIVTLNTATNGGFWLIENTPVIFSNVTGYSIPPSGLELVVKFVEDGFYNKFKIIQNLGTGSFTSGNAMLFFESYAVPYTAGMLAFIRDSLECSWWEARYRMRMTASGEGSILLYNGYGKPDVLAAINYSGSIPPDPYDILGTVGTLSAVRQFSNSVVIDMDSVANALNYQIYNRSQLLGTYSSHGIVTVDIERNLRDAPYEFWYKALRGTQQSAESDKIKVPFYYYNRIKTK